MTGRAAERGSVFFYILAAIFLLGVLVVTLTGGPQKSATTGQLDELSTLVHGDLKQIAAAINECVLSYPAAADLDGDGSKTATDNPNPPFPLYSATLPPAAPGSYGGTGAAFADITCPGAPGLPKVFDPAKGRYLRVLGDASAYTVNYLTDTTEGVLIRVTSASANPLWTEAISRLNKKYSACSAAAVTAGGTCVNGCFYLWIMRRTDTTAIGTTGAEAACAP
jgi:hypothetical protein